MEDGYSIINVMLLSSCTKLPSHGRTWGAIIGNMDLKTGKSYHNYHIDRGVMMGSNYWKHGFEKW